MFGDCIASKLWTEKYRPGKMEDYVFKNPALKVMFEKWISEGTLPHILFHGPAGTGKTSAIKVLLGSIPAIDPNDVMTLNMSDEGMDAVREKVLPFCQTRAFGAYKVVVLEEFEQTSHKSQASLKRIMEDYSDSVRFLITSNQPNKILDPIRSRTQEVQIESHDYGQFMTRMLEILIEEGLTDTSPESIERIEKYVKVTYPDFRKCINTLQQNFVDGRIIELNSTTSGTSPYQFQIVEAIKAGNLSACRKQIVGSIKDTDVDGFFTWLYQNIEIWIPTDMDANSADALTCVIIQKIRDGLANDTLVSDREVNLAGTLVDIQLAVLAAKAE